MIPRELIPEWRLAHRFWSVRIAIFWSIVAGLYVALPAFYGFVSPVTFALISIGFSVAICIARLTHQPGLD